MSWGADPRRFVVNASPLILLSHIDALPLLAALADEVIAPMAVIAEIRVGVPDDPQSAAVGQLPWLDVRPDLPIPPEIAAWDLGGGESQVLAHAQILPNAEAVLDDGQGRRCAR